MKVEEYITFCLKQKIIKYTTLQNGQNSENILSESNLVRYYILTVVNSPRLQHHLKIRNDKTLVLSIEQL